MLDTIASPTGPTGDHQYTGYRIHQQTFCRDRAAIARGPLLILWRTAAQAQARGFTAGTRCHCSLTEDDPSPP